MKLDPRLAEVPVLVVSTESQRARDTLSLGADDFLPKPVTLEDLRRRVAAMLRRPNSRHASRLLPYPLSAPPAQELALALNVVSVVAPRPAMQPACLGALPISPVISSSMASRCRCWTWPRA